METNAPSIEHDAASTYKPHAVLAGPSRFDGYFGIHKAMRLCMCDTLAKVGSADPGDDDQMQSALNQVRDLLNFCELHIKHENQFIHPVLEKARTGSAARIQREHVEHGEAIANLRDLVGLVADAGAETRAGTLTRLYRALALFVADNFEHMHVEETDHNAVLWAHYTDLELISIERELVASIPPPEMVRALHWFLPALAAPERAEMLRAMQANMPPEPFLGVMAIARRTISVSEFTKLCRALNVKPTSDD